MLRSGGIFSMIAMGICPEGRNLAMTIESAPDGDGVDSGVENFFGTDPSKFSQGLVAGGVNGNEFTFIHPLNDNPASDLTATYRWSINLVEFHAAGTPNATGTTTVTFVRGASSGGQVNATASVSGSVDPDRLFVGVEVSGNPSPSHRSDLRDASTTCHFKESDLPPTNRRGSGPIAALTVPEPAGGNEKI